VTAFARAARFARRELRGGISGFRIFLLSLTLGVASIAGVGSLGQAFLTGLKEQGRVLLGGDISLRRLYRPADDGERAFIEQFGRVSAIATMRSMASQGERRTLIELKAVDAAYPLIGQMSLTPDMTLGAALGCGPQCGVAVEDTLIARLGARVGDTLRIGGADFRIRARIVDEPDRVEGGFSLGPRALVSEDGLRQSGLAVEGSLITHGYRIALKGDIAPDDMREALSEEYPSAGFRITDRDNAVPSVTRFVRQATMFLTLVGLTALIVGGVGAAQAVGAFIARRRTTIATLKSLGTESGDIVLIYLLQIMAVALLGIVTGLALGAALPFAVQRFFGDAIPAPANYAIYATPLVLAAAFGGLSAFGFALPPLARSYNISPAGLFRDLVSPSTTPARLRLRLYAAAALGTVAVLAVALSPYPLFTLYFLGGAAAVLVVLRLLSNMMRRLLVRLPQRSQITRLAFTNLTRPGAPAGDAVVALGLGLTLLATVTLIAGSVRNEVQDQFPERAPSFFFVDIQQADYPEFETLVKTYPTAEDFQATPMLRGRIARLNGVPVSQAQVDESVRWALNGDRGVTYAREKPKDVRVTEGPDWWSADYSGETLVSLDGRLAEGFGLTLGDTIAVNVLGRELEARIFNVRDVDYRTGGINFTFILSPGIVDQAPHSFLSTVRLGPAEEERLFQEVSRRFPNITIVRVKEALSEVGGMLEALANAIGAASLVTILSGILVLAGAIAAGHRARLYDAVILKVLGATRARLALVYAIEYGLLGALSGVAAFIAGLAASWGVTYFVLEIGLHVSLAPLLLTICGGALLSLTLGLAGGFAALREKPAARLRNP